VCANVDFPSPWRLATDVVAVTLLVTALRRRRAR
jgi:hypothetical protein